MRPCRASGELSGQQLLHPIYDLGWRRRLSNNGRRGERIVDPIASGIEEKWNSPRLKLSAQLAAPAVKNGGREVGMVGQCQSRAGVRSQQDLSSIRLERPRALQQPKASERSEPHAHQASSPEWSGASSARVHTVPTSTLTARPESGREGVDWTCPCARAQPNLRPAFRAAVLEHDRTMRWCVRDRHVMSRDNMSAAGRREFP